MKLLKEILYLISLLIFTFPGQYRLLETQKLHYFPITSRGWMMWCGVLVHKEEFEQWGKNKHDWMRMNIRLYQAKEHHFSWTTFYIRFWFDILVGSWFCDSWRGGYYTSPYILEEYAQEENQYYLHDYTYSNLERYRLGYVERRKLWKEVGQDKEKLIKAARITSWKN